jgi:sigma-E factor negative regulatory protein RseC
MPGTRERGTVTAAGDGAVDVRVQATAACENCSACCRVDKDGVTVEGARDPLGAAVGDLVEVEIPEGADTRAGVLVFILPVLGLLVGYAIGAAVSTALGQAPDLGGAIGAVLAIAVALVVVRVRGRAVPDERFRPVVRAIIARNLPASSTSEDGFDNTL